MTNLMNTGENATITSLDLLNIINGYRAEEGLNKTTNSKFIDKVEDELDGLKGLEHYANLDKGTPMKFYLLNYDQCLLVGMRESKNVRKKVLVLINEMKSALRNITPNTFSDALYLAAEQQKTIEALQSVTVDQKLIIERRDETIEENKPKVVFAETVKGSSNSILVREFAKLLQNSGIDVGQNRLFAWFRDKGYLMKDNEPYQNYIAQGLFEVIERTIGDSDNTITVRTTKITGKGQTYFTNKIVK